MTSLVFEILLMIVTLAWLGLGSNVTLTADPV